MRRILPLLPIVIVMSCAARPADAQSPPPRPYEPLSFMRPAASDDASYVTGPSIFVDGGMSDYPAFRHGG